MSVSDTPSRVERLLDRALPSRRTRGAAQEADGLKHLTDLLCPDAAPAPERAGIRPYDTPGRAG